MAFDHIRQLQTDIRAIIELEIDGDEYGLCLGTPEAMKKIMQHVCTFALGAMHDSSIQEELMNWDYDKGTVE
jgi:hypothetical protein